MGRRAGPAGFLLAALLFVLLPMVAVSCEAGTGQDRGSLEVAFTGAGIVRDTPDVSTSGTLARTPEGERAYAARLDVMDPLVRTLAAAALVVAVLGVPTVLIGGTRRRRIAAAAAAVLAGALVVVTERLALDRLEAEAREQFAGPLSTAPDRGALLRRIHEAVEIGPGFWAVLGTLGLILALNAALLIRGTRRHRSRASPTP